MKSYIKILLSIIMPLLLQALEEPSSLYFTNISNSSVTLHWQDNSTNETGFKIYRDNFLIKILPQDTITYTDTALQTQKLYHYTIKATDDNVTIPIMPITYTSWQSMNASTMTTPDFLSYKKDLDTNFSVCRLGGDVTEMHNTLNHPIAKEEINELHAQHFYSRTNPTNKDETYAISASIDGYLALWKLDTKSLVAWIPTGERSDEQQAQVLWDKNDTNVLWYNTNNQLHKLTLNLGNYSVINDTTWDTFTDYESITFGQGEGDFSDDGTKIVLIGRQIPYDKNNTIIAYNISSKSIVATKMVKDIKDLPFDWAGVDPTGEFIVFSDPEKGRITWVSRFDLSDEPRILYKNMKHSDFIKDAQGDSWIVFGHYQGLFASKLSIDHFKRLWPTALELGNPSDYPHAVIDIDDLPIKSASGHISRVANVPGVVLFSRNIDGGFYFVSLDNPEHTMYAGNSRHGTPVVAPQTKEKWGVDEEGEVTSYNREARVSASGSGKYIFFTSDYHIHEANYTDPEPTLKAFLNMIEVKNQ